MDAHRVDVFFYGSYINFDVLAEADIDQRSYEVVSAQGFELTISPLANLKPARQGVVFGILIQLTHVELDKLYNEHAMGKLGGVYFPEAVMVRGDSGEFRPALTYIAHEMEVAKADPAYVDRILKPAQAYGFPTSFNDHIQSFK